MPRPIGVKLRVARAVSTAYENGLAHGGQGDGKHRPTLMPQRLNLTLIGRKLCPTLMSNTTMRDFWAGQSLRPYGSGTQEPNCELLPIHFVFLMVSLIMGIIASWMRFGRNELCPYI